MHDLGRGISPLRASVSLATKWALHKPGPGVPGERDTSVALGRNPQKASPGPCQNSLGCEGQRGRWMLSSRSSVLRRERRKEGDSLRGSQRRRVQTSVARLDPNRAHAAPRGLGTGRGAGGRAERARRGGLREGRPRGPGACCAAISPKRTEERHRGVPRGAPSARCGRGAHSPEALAPAVNLQQQQQQQHQQHQQGGAGGRPYAAQAR